MTEPSPSTSSAVRPARPAPPRVVRRGLDVVKGLALGAVVTIGAAAHVQAGTTAAPSVVPTPVDTGLDRLMADHRCSTSGFADGSIPAASILRTSEGELRVVSFARGWAAYEGDLPGELVAVCRGPRAEQP